METETSKNRERKSKTFFIIQLILLLMIAFIIVTSASITVVDGSSMNPTYQNNDVVFAMSKKEIKRFDVVVFNDPNSNSAVKKYFIKRVIGLPGETIEIVKDGIVVDGVLIEEPFSIIPDDNIEYLMITLGDDEYFVLGDNRANSNDSREFGPIKKESIKNIVVFNIYKQKGE